ncbi:CWC16 protein [Gorgonomyces haynaldii]|nr:CWC16 protein [Gorgonomyces haynaldii]
MSERKVLNKYIPPSINPAKDVNDKNKRKGGGKKNHKVRLMAPCSMQCTTCGDFIYKGKKFNARKESAKGETYLGIEIFRFWIRCPRCAGEISFKTDPQNTDYTIETGAVRNFEPWRVVKDPEVIAAEERAKLEEENDPIKALERRTMEAKREMDILDALDEIKTKNAMLERVDADAILDKIHDSRVVEVSEQEKLLEEEDELLAKKAFQNADGEFVKRAYEEEPIKSVFEKEIKPVEKKRKPQDLLLSNLIKKPASVALVGYASDSD